MFNMQNVGRKISELRKKNNMTQMELADLMGISFQSVSNWERGLTMPDISKLPELADLFDVSIDELLGKESKLIESVVEGKTDEYINENHVSINELAEAAPVLKPETVTEIVKKTDMIGIKLDKLRKLSDMSETSKLSKLSKLPKMPEFADKDSADTEDDKGHENIDIKAENFSLKEIEPLIPFLDNDIIDEIAKKTEDFAGNLISTLLPFVSKTVINVLADKRIESGKNINEFFPFMEEENIDDLAEKAVKDGKSIDSFLPFMSDDKIDEIAYSIYLKNGVNAIASYAPFMSSKMLNKIARESLEKNGFKSISPITPFLD